MGKTKQSVIFQSKQRSLKNSHKQGNEMFCVSFVLMKMKSNFNSSFVLERLSVKNTNTSYSLPLHPIVLSICVCSPSRYTNKQNNLEMYARKTG